MVRRKDWGKAVDVLAREGLVRREMLPAVEPEAPAAGRGQESMSFAAAPSGCR